MSPLFGIVCYLIALTGCGAFAAFVLLLGLDAWPFPPLFPSSAPWAVNLAWLLAFAAQHSVMAREGVKRWMRAIIPLRAERSLYAGLSGLLLLALPLVWQPLPGPPLWALPPVLVLVPLAAALGLALINLRYDHLGLFGLRQALAPEGPEPPEVLIVSGPYRYVRHPLMACLLLFLWAQPTLSPSLALLAGGLSGYILLGTALEERDLVRRFGPAYRAYRAVVPRLVPWRGAAVANEGNE